MPKKSKINLKGAFKLAFAIALALFGSGFLHLNHAKAEVYLINQVELGINLLVKGADGVYKETNFARAGVSDGVIEFKAVITLKDPQTLKQGDFIDFGTTWFGKREIKDVGAGLDIYQEGNTCKNLDLEGFFSADKRLVECDLFFPYGYFSKTAEKMLRQGVPVEIPFRLTSADFARLRLTDSNKFPAGVTPRFYVYPYLEFTVALRESNAKAAFTAPALYVQLYDTQEKALEADKKNEPAPSDVKGGGEVISSVNSYERGGPLLGLINNLVGIIIGMLQEIVYAVFFWLIAPIIQAMLSIRTYSDTFVGVIYPGWEVVRNLSNMVFIVALIAIGLGTLFRLESYQYKHMLVQLILAALLVNFSLVIAQVILGVADTVQSQFLPNNVEVIRALAKDLMVAHRSVVYNWDFSSEGYFSSLVQPLFFLALSLGSFAVFCAIAIFLVIRIVVLWVLLLISPLAYVAGVLPATTRYRSEWWSNFIKYAFFTPVMAFFLNMTAVMANLQKENPVLKQISSAEFGNSDLATFVFRVASNVLLLVFLIVGLKFADSLGIVGGKAITSMAEKGIYAPFVFAGKGAKAAAGRSVEGVRNTIGLPSFKEIKEGWQSYSEEKKKERALKRKITGGFLGKRLGINVSNPHDVFNSYINREGLKRMGRFALNGFRGFKHEINKAEEIQDRNNIMTDAERVDLERQQTYLSTDMAEISGAAPVIGNSRAQKIKERFLKMQQGLIGESKSLADKAQALQQSGQMESRDYVLIEKAQVDSQLADLTNAIKDIDLQINNPFNTGTVDLSAYKGESYFEENLFDAEKNIINDEQVRLSNLAIADDNRRTKYNLGRYGVAGYQPIDETKKSGFKKEYDDLLSKARDLKRPESYYLRVARLQAESEEGKKIADIAEADELIRYYNDAVKEHNFAKATAIVKKLAKDANFNEILGAKKLPASYEGAKRFFEEIMVKDFQMPKDQMMQVATEVGYINEDTKWWDLARLTAVTPGGIKWNDNSHDVAIYTEMSKGFPQQIGRSYSRLAFVRQQAGPDGWKSVEIHKGGRALIKQLDLSEKTRQEFYNQLRPNTAAAIVGVKDWEQTLRADGVSDEMINNLRKRAGSEKGGGVTLSDGTTFGKQ